MPYPNFIKKVRLTTGLTQEVVASKIHLGLRAYQKIENGETKLDIERLQQLAAIFNVSVLDLVAISDAVDINSNVGAVSNKEVTINQNTPIEEVKQVYELLLKAKDEIIKVKDEEITILKEELLYLKK